MHWRMGERKVNQPPDLLLRNLEYLKGHVGHVRTAIKGSTEETKERYRQVPWGSRVMLCSSKGIGGMLHAAPTFE